MASLTNLLKAFAAIMILIPLVWTASCAMLGLGAAAAVNQVAQSDVTKQVVKKAIKAHSDHERRAHNEELNRESSYYEHAERYH